MKRRILFMVLIMVVGISVLSFARASAPIYWDKYGKWIKTDDYGIAWRPNVWKGWKPYFYGVWKYDKGYGLVWNSFEPWGWVTYHYGYWVLLHKKTWIWVPGKTWHPGRVAWFKWKRYIAWAPLTPDNRPYFHDYAKRNKKLIAKGTIIINTANKSLSYISVYKIKSTKTYGKISDPFSHTDIVKAMFSKWNSKFSKKIFLALVGNDRLQFFKELRKTFKKKFTQYKEKNKYSMSQNGQKYVYPSLLQSTSYPFPVHFPKSFNTNYKNKKGIIDEWED